MASILSQPQCLKPWNADPIWDLKFILTVPTDVLTLQLIGPWQMWEWFYKYNFQTHYAV